MTTHKFNREEKANLLHALRHLEENKIADDSRRFEGWYCGNKQQFIRRHLKAIEFIQSMLKSSDPV